MTSCSCAGNPELSVIASERDQRKWPNVMHVSLEVIPIWRNEAYSPVSMPSCTAFWAGWRETMCFSERWCLLSSQPQVIFWGQKTKARPSKENSLFCHLQESSWESQELCFQDREGCHPSGTQPSRSQKCTTFYHVLTERINPGLMSLTVSRGKSCINQHECGKAISHLHEGMLPQERLSTVQVWGYQQHPESHSSFSTSWLFFLSPGVGVSLLIFIVLYRANLWPGKVFYSPFHIHSVPLKNQGARWRWELFFLLTTDLLKKYKSTFNCKAFRRAV